MATLAEHQHGKSSVRVGRVWRTGEVHHMVEWTVDTMLESAMEHAFVHGSNEGMTATDTQKNTVYYIAKQCDQMCSPEEFALKLARHFVDTYSPVSAAKVWVTAAPWQRVVMHSQPHDHGFTCNGDAVRTVYVRVARDGSDEITAGVKGWKVLKTTQSGYEGYTQDAFTTLKPTRDRIMATSVTASWRYRKPPSSYDAAWQAAKHALAAAFFGPCCGGVYSPSVQFTLFEMGKAALAACPEMESIYLNLPNLHFMPCSTVVGGAFDNDVYVATSEPHGNIEATITRAHAQPHHRL